MDFAYTLALALGCSVRQIYDLPAEEVLGWQAYYQTNPFGSWRDNFHSATIAHILAMANRNPKRPAPEIKDFFYLDKTSREKDRDTATILFFDSKAK